jgi:probable HAF family extracellular repeat protein
MLRSIKSLCCATVLVLAIGQRASSGGEVRYTVTDLGTLGGRSSVATSINNHGQIVGWSYTGEILPGGVSLYRAFLYENGVMRDLGALAPQGSSDANAINDAGQIVGQSFTADRGPQHAFLYQNGTFNDLGTLGGGSTSVSYASAINAAGRIAGASTANASGDTRAFVHHNGTMTNLGTLPGGNSSGAGGINDAGQIVGASSTLVGQRGFLYENGQMTWIGTLGGYHSAARDINNRGQIIGSSNVLGNSNNHAFVYENGQMSDLGTLYGSFSYCTAINESGQIVGDSAAQGNPMPYGARVPFLYENGTMTDLHELVAPDTAWNFSFAGDINDAGWIVGSGINPDGETHAFLLMPVPEPAHCCLAVCGLALLRRRRAN